MAWEGFTCRRCGKKYLICTHVNTASADISDAHAERIQARYAFGKRFNPDHDTADYYMEEIK